MGIALLGALARSKDELIGVRSDGMDGYGKVNTVIPLRKPGISFLCSYIIINERVRRFHFMGIASLGAQAGAKNELIGAGTSHRAKSDSREVKNTQQFIS